MGVGVGGVRCCRRTAQGVLQKRVPVPVHTAQQYTRGVLLKYCVVRVQKPVQTVQRYRREYRPSAYRAARADGPRRSAVGRPAPGSAISRVSTGQ
eukprot:3458111-Rhodomonas_salina.1